MEGSATARTKARPTGNSGTLRGRLDAVQPIPDSACNIDVPLLISTLIGRVPHWLVAEAIVFNVKVHGPVEGPHDGVGFPQT